VPRTRGERGAHRACEQDAPETPHSSGQGGSMFYVRENLLYVLVNALQERYYGFPNSMSRRLANACALLTKLRKLPDSRRNSGAVLFTTPRDDYEFCYSKNTACDSSGEPVHLWQRFLDLRPPIAKRRIAASPAVWMHHTMKVLPPPWRKRSRRSRIESAPQSRAARRLMKRRRNPRTRSGPHKVMRFLN
jgi:hypothetical protein